MTAPVYVSFRSLKTALQPFIREGKRLPSKDFFARARRYDLVTGIRNHGGWQEVRRKLGQPQAKRLGKDSYAIWDNAKRRLEELKFPIWTRLQRIDSGLAAAITAHHGGYIEAKRKCGKPVALGFGLDEWRNLRPLLEELMREHDGDLPPAGDLMHSRKPRDRAVYKAIKNHHDGMAAVREKIGLKIRRFTGVMSLRHRRNFDDVLKPLVEKLGYFPTSTQLAHLKLYCVIHACRIYHGGFDAVRREYGFQLVAKRGERSLRHWENLERELKGVILLTGCFPTATDLRRMKKRYVYRAMNVHHDGIDAVRRKFGVKPLRKRGFESLRFWDNYLRELVAIARELRHFPSQTQLKALGRFDLVGAAKHHGRLRAVRARFNDLVARGEIRLDEVALPERAPERREPHAINLLDLLDFFKVEPTRIIGNIVQTITGVYMLVLAPLSTSALPPIVLQTSGGMYAFDPAHAWVVSLFIKLSSTRSQDRLEATNEIKTLIKGAPQEKNIAALTLLRNAYMNEKDRQTAKEMEKVLESRHAKPVWELFGDQSDFAEQD